ncbi:hypothetical protein H072_2156 [Dactylellina haptotyla CBS 200.50]|uniref:non-specific serine/threonine protein kinase n=1 Tax=Dactylellina haptotyla (strain CBS 200.50) TaxID=1284197 RepID=S8C8C8_DACHA|nr:hypothetical protein H072_2156 [Dactylellina haptotyla CBS 200.50]
MTYRQLTGRDPEYEFIAALGQGGFGTVAKVRRVRDGKIMACKAIDCRPDPNIFMFATREIDTWSTFGSEKYIANFSKDVAWVDQTRTVKLYMDFYEGGDLQRVIDECRHEATLIHPFIATYWAMEIARGVKACHDHAIIHRDLKPSNVLLSIPYTYNDVLWAVSDGRELNAEQSKLGRDFLEWLANRPPWCHITDFGLGKFSHAARVSGQQTAASFVGVMGTPGFMAPETVGNNPNFSIKSDIYSLGCLLYALCCSDSPPRPSNLNSIPQIPEIYPQRLRDIIMRCMDIDPNRRPNSRDVSNEVSEAYVDIMDHQTFGQMKSKLRTVTPGNLGELSGLGGLMRNLQVTGNPTEQVNRASPSPVYPAISRRAPDPDPGLHQSQVNPDDLLREAVYTGDTRKMAGALMSRANPGILAFDEQGMNNDWSPRPLFTALGLRRAKAARSYFKSGYVTLVSLAIYLGHEDCLLDLLTAGARGSNVNNSSDCDMRTHAMFVAVDRHRLVAINILQEYGYDLNIKEKGSGIMPLCMAAGLGDAEMVDKLLKLGASPRISNARGYYPLHYACSSQVVSKFRGKEVDCVDLLITAAPDLINTPATNGDTPIIRAVARFSVHNSLDLVEKLISAGANPWQQNKAKYSAYTVRDHKSEIMAVKRFSTVRAALAKSEYSRTRLPRELLIPGSVRYPPRNNPPG